MSSNLFEDLNEFADGMFNFTVPFFLRRNDSGAVFTILSW